MVHAIRMPMMGNTMESGLLAEWRVEEGDHVKENDLVAVVESEKAAADVAADRDGVLARIDVQEGEEVPPGTLLGVIVGDNESLEEAPPPRSRIEPGGEHANEPDDSPSESTGQNKTPEPDPPSSETADEVRATPGARKLASGHNVDLAMIEGSGQEGAVLRADVEEQLERDGDVTDAEPTTGSPDAGRIFASPSTRRLARDLGVSISEVKRSDPGDRVTESDVRAAAGQLDAPPSGSVSAAEDADDAHREPRDAGALGVTIEAEQELSQMRRTIAVRMSRSARQAPHVTNNREVNAERALDAADDLATKYDAPIGFMDILIAAVTRALDKHPRFNAWYEDERLRLIAERNIAIAVDTEAGLVTPVIRDAASESVHWIAAERRQLTERTFEGSFTMDDLQGGTFTITNLGMFGVDSFDPIINPPQVAILGVGRIREDAEEQTCVLSLSFDHRVVDGANAARFLATITEGLESPVILTTEQSSPRGSEHESTATASVESGHDGSKPTETIPAAIVRDLREQAKKIASAHGWPIPEFEVRLTDERPTISVEVPESASPATMKRLSYAACRESTYAGTINQLHDPKLVLV